MVDTNSKLKVAVLMGGISSERNVSLSTGRRILESLDRNKYDVIGVDTALLPGSSRTLLKGADTEVQAVTEARDALAAGRLLPISEVICGDRNLRPDVCFIALHGKYGEDGTIQGLLELLGIPYTGSGVLASALAMDKSMTKKVLATEGIPVPPSIDFSRSSDVQEIALLDLALRRHCEYGLTGPVRSESSACLISSSTGTLVDEVNKLGYPVIVKPSRQGSTIGMMKVENPDGLNNALKLAAEYDSLILVEKFIEGIELTVGVLGNEKPFPLPVIEIVPNKGFYDYEAKYTPGATQEIVPARISAALTKKAQEIAIAAHCALGCSGMCRVDMILDGTDLWVLEVNTIPGMTPTSLLPRAAEAAGISFPKLLDMLIDFALEEEGNT